MTKRTALLTAIETMPDEAFGWLLIALATIPGRANVWPDGLGGFMPASRTSIARVRVVATQMLNDEPVAVDDQVQRTLRTAPEGAAEAIEAIARYSTTRDRLLAIIIDELAPPLTLAQWAQIVERAAG